MQENKHAGTFLQVLRNKMTYRYAISETRLKLKDKNLNPFMMNGLYHHYHLGESTVISRVIRSDFEFLFQFFYENPLSKQNSTRSGARLFAFVP